MTRVTFRRFAIAVAAVLLTWLIPVSAPLAQAQTVTANLSFISGWNLVGMGSSGSIDVAATFGDANKVTTVWKWVPAKSAWAFYTPSLAGQALSDYAAGKGYDVLTRINGGEGFWVNAKSAFTAQLPTGVSITSPQFLTTLLSGWNLIATGDSKAPREFNDALSPIRPAVGDIPTNVTTLWAWDAALANWYFYAPSLDKSGGLANYVISKGYLDFGTRVLDPATGFWVNVPGPAVIESASRSISAAQGGTITLAGGSSVTIPAGALAADQTVTLSLVSSMPKQPPSGIIASIGPALVLSFGTNQPFQGTTRTAGLQFVLKYGTSIPAELSGSAPIADIVDDDNLFGLVSLSCDSSSSCTVVPQELLKDLPTVASINVGAATLRQSIVPPLPEPGALYWNGTNWIAGMGPLDPTKRYLLLVHGMTSSVQNAFGDYCTTEQIINNLCNVEKIRKAGGYDAVIGFNYDWTQNISDSGNQLSQYLSSLKAAGLEQIDIEAHSLGGPVALAASCFNSDDPPLKIGNIAMLGSPVMGTPLANRLGLLAQVGTGTAVDISPLLTWLANLNTPYQALRQHSLQELLDSPIFANLQPDSETLTIVRACVAQKMASATSNLASTRIICVAGTADIAARNPLFLYEPNDGAVNQASANCVGAGFDKGRVTTLVCPVNHLHLETDDSCVIPNVGRVLSAAVVPTIQVFRGTGTGAGTVMQYSELAGLVCTPDPVVATATNTAATVELVLDANPLVAGPLSGTLYIGSSSLTVTAPGRTCTNGTDSFPVAGITRTDAIPGASYPISGHSDGTNITIDPDPESAYPGCTESFTGSLAVAPVTGVVQLTAWDTMHCAISGLEASYTLTYTLTRQ